MNDIPALLERNLRALEKSQPRLAAKLRSRLEELPGLKEPTYQQTPAGRWVHGMTENPFFEKKTLLEKRGKTPPSAVYLLFGTGAPPYLFHVLRSLPREALSVVVIEPSIDLLLLTLSQTSVFQALPAGSRISFLVDDDRALLDELFTWNIVPIGIFPVEKAAVIAHDGEAEAVDFSQLEARFRKTTVYSLTMLGNSPEDTLLGLRHAVLNTPRTLRSTRLSDLKAAYGGKPFVLVASGPSLEKNEHLLNDIQDKCVIVACDTVLFRLLERGITPHVVTSIERPYVTYAAWVPKALENYPEECKRILLLSQSVSYPLTAGRWPGPKIVVGKMDVPVDSWFNAGVLGEQLLRSGLSVSHMALSLAFICEAPAVALVGQDLAYGEGGVSHASQTIPDEVLEIERSMRKGAIPVPGALGGVVETSRIWLAFIQIFERLIPLRGETLVYDCTEGGALIEGADALPLSRYIEERLLPLEESLTRWEPGASEREADWDAVLERFDQSLGHLDMLDAKLEEMRSGIARCAAPALTPERRQTLALAVGETLDGIHAMNPVLSFIGQSYTYLSGAVLAENRFLENVEQVSRWKNLHEEIVEAHAYASSFMREWLRFGGELVRAARAAPAARGGNGEEAFDALYLALNDGPGREERLAACAEIFSVHDPLREEWSPDSLWRGALLLFGQGRAEEGRRFMARAYELMEGSEIASETIGAFFKDWGKMAAADDLCAYPLTADAMTYFANARERLPDDEEIPALQKELLERRRSHLIETGRAKAVREDDLTHLLLRNEAETALLEGDLPAALDKVERLVWEMLDARPDIALPYMTWLMKTAASCLDAADERIVSLSNGVLETIVERLPLLREHRVAFPAEFLGYLARRGVKFAAEATDN